MVSMLVSAYSSILFPNNFTQKLLVRPGKWLKRFCGFFSGWSLLLLFMNSETGNRKQLIFSMVLKLSLRKVMRLHFVS